MTSNQPQPTSEEFLGVLDALVSTQKAVAALQAVESLLYAAAGRYALLTARATSGRGSDSESSWRSTAMEIGAALHVSDRAITGRVNTALTLADNFGATMAAWSRGDITRDHAHAIMSAGTPLQTDEARDALQERVLAFAGEETPTRTRATARVIASQLDRHVLKLRQDTAVELRDVRVVDLEDGVSELIATLPTTLAHAVVDRLTQAAKVVARAERNAARIERTAIEAGHVANGSGRTPNATGRTINGVGQTDSASTAPVANTDTDINTSARFETLARGDEDDRLPDDATGEQTSPTTLATARRVGAVRADLLADLLLTGAPSAAQLPYTDEGQSLDLRSIRGRVQVIVTEDALFGHSDELPVIDGGGAFPIEQARAIAAATGTWDRLTIDPALNMLTKVDTYRPSLEQRRYLTALDEHCRQPGCSRQAQWCDIDHAHDAAYGGATELNNLSNLCEPHHVIKHADGWTIKKKPDGTLLWTSKHGRTYPDIPRPAVAFMVSPPDSEPALAGRQTSSHDEVIPF